jgi:Kef-type K+ transport system membrane component KefB
VGLIVAAAGYIAGAISLGLYGAAVAVSVVTTLVTPAMLKPLFKKQWPGEVLEKEAPEIASNNPEPSDSS